MATTNKPVRQSVSLASRIARRVRALAKTKRTSSSRIIAELVESGLEAQELERRRFLELADRLVQSTEAKERQLLKEELARFTFGD